MRLSLGTAIPRRDAVVRIRTADHPINSRGLYRTELRRPARPYKRAAQIVSQPRSGWLNPPEQPGSPHDPRPSSLEKGEHTWLANLTYPSRLGGAMIASL